jgi:hypothetical protein
MVDVLAVTTTKKERRPRGERENAFAIAVIRLLRQND